MHFTELRVAGYFIDAVLRDPDKSISVHGDGEYADVEKSREYFTIRDHMGECDFDDVGVERSTWSHTLHGSSLCMVTSAVPVNRWK